MTITVSQPVATGSGAGGGNDTCVKRNSKERSEEHEVKRIKLAPLTQQPEDAAALKKQAPMVQQSEQARIGPRDREKIQIKIVGDVKKMKKTSTFTSLGADGEEDDAGDAPSEIKRVIAVKNSLPSSKKSGPNVISVVAKSSINQMSSQQQKMTMIDNKKAAPVGGGGFVRQKDERHVILSKTTIGGSKIVTPPPLASSASVQASTSFRNLLKKDEPPSVQKVGLLTITQKPAVLPVVKSKWDEDSPKRRSRWESSSPTHRKK